tara:strand:- start:278 stop:571 length:294 start_codon:yes stop_codon:yes gene_type:complete
MKNYTEFTNEDLQQFLADNGFIRNSKRGTEERVMNYEKLSEILGCQQRQSRNLVSGIVPLQRGQYNLLALHAGYMEPQLCAQTMISGSEAGGRHEAV